MYGFGFTVIVSARATPRTRTWSPLASAVAPASDPSPVTMIELYGWSEAMSNTSLPLRPSRTRSSTPGVSTGIDSGALVITPALLTTIWSMTSRPP